VHSLLSLAVDLPGLQCVTRHATKPYKYPGRRIGSVSFFFCPSSSMPKTCRTTPPYRRRRKPPRAKPSTPP
jgi:hypothetical protein